MQEYLYDCDGGTLKIGNDQFTACFPNCYGDGTFRVKIMRRGEFPSKKVGYHFMGSVSGKDFHVYQYDCDNEILCTLSGTYGVFARNGNMLLEQWDE